MYSEIYYGSKRIRRIYHGGQVVWESKNNNTVGQVISILSGFGLIDYQTPIEIKMPLCAGVEGSTFAVPCDVVSGLFSRNEFISTATPSPADTKSGAGSTVAALTMCARPTSGSMVFSRGQDGWEIHIVGSSVPADTVEARGAATASQTGQALPHGEEVFSIHFSASGKEIGQALSDAQNADRVKMGTSSKMDVSSAPMAKTVCTVTFMDGEKALHQEEILEGEICADPVVAGIIAKPTKASDAQYHYHYSGWSLTDGGEPIGGAVTKTEILPQTKYEGFTQSSQYYGLLVYNVNPKPFDLEVGKTYTVVWDGIEWECKAQDMSEYGGALALGNTSLLSGVDSGEPFIIGWSEQGVSYIELSGVTTHTVTIYRHDVAEGLLAVEKDTILYAAYDKELRYYTIRFYDDDHETLLETQTVAYGNVPSYTPEKDGYAFDGWTPELSAVSGDADYYAKWISAEVILYSGTCGTDAKWTINDAGLLRISGTGDMTAFGSYGSVPWYQHRSIITTAVVEEGITNIPPYAFYQQTELIEVSLPDSLTLIRYDSFNKCTKLTSITIPKNVTSIHARMCRGCTALQNVTIDSDVITTIGQEAFQGCTSLTSITIPASVTQIADAAFASSGLTTAIFEVTSGWYRTTNASATSGTATNMSNPTTAATYMRSTYWNYNFKRN